MNLGKKGLIWAVFGTSIIGLMVVASVFLGSLYPNFNSRPETLRLDIKSLSPGDLLQSEQGQLPVWVLRRTPDMLSKIEKENQLLSNPFSAQSNQPESAQNSYRAINPSVFVFLPLFDWTVKANNVKVPRYRFVDKHTIEVYLGNIGRY